MFHFVYITTNLINGKQYVGDHSTDDLSDGYIGSGKPAFNNAKRKYGKQNFKLKILEFFPTKQEAFDAQEKYIKLYETHISQGGYNISWKGGYGVNGSYLSEETKKKIRNYNIGKKRSSITKEKISKIHKGKILSEETKKKISSSLLGRPLLNETKKKISDSMKGHSFSESSLKKMRKPKSNTINMKGPKSEKHKNSLKGKNLGRTHTLESRKNMSNSHKGIKLKLKICEYCERYIPVNVFNRFHGNNCKLKK